MPQTKDPEEFRAYWEEHVAELSKLHHTLDDEFDHETLRSCTEQLEELVDRAAENLEE